MFKRFQEIQDKYNDLMSNNSANSARGEIDLKNHYDSQFAERMSRSQEKTIMRSKLNDDEFFYIERNPTTLKHKAIKRMVRLDIKRPQTSTKLEKTLR